MGRRRYVPDCLFPILTTRRANWRWILRGNRSHCWGASRSRVSTAAPRGFYRQTVQGGVLLGTNQGFLVGRSGTQAGFLTKFSADGSQVLFSTFLDNAAFVASDAQGNTIVAGTEVRKFDTTGDLIYQQPLSSTATALTVDASGDALVAVEGECPTIVKLDPSGHTIFSQQTQPCGVITLLSVDASGAIYAAGYPSAALATTPTAFQASPPSQGLPGFLAVLSPAADKVNYLSYAGIGASAMSVDASGNIYLAGPNSYWLSLPATSSFTFTYPGFPASYLYVMKVNPSSSKPLWIDTFGSPTAFGAVSSLQTDPSGNVWFSGQTLGLIPLVAPLEAEGTENNFVAEISADGTELLFSSYGPPYLAVGLQSSVYLAGSVTPPNKSATSAVVVKLDASASSSSVIDSIGGAVQPAKEWLPTSVGIAPGEMIRISGRGLGPLATLTAKVDATGRVATALNGVQALVNGVPAPLISVHATSIVCMTPFEVSGNTDVSVQVVQGHGVAGRAGCGWRQGHRCVSGHSRRPESGCGHLQPHRPLPPTRAIRWWCLPRRVSATRNLPGAGWRVIPGAFFRCRFTP